MKPGADVIALIEASLRDAPPEALEFFERERAAAGELLDAARSATLVAEVALAAAARLEPLAFELTRERPPACGRGCSRCCHGLKIEASAWEAVAIAEFLRGLEPQELRETRGQMAEEAAFARTLDADTRWREQTPCAFLDDASGECVIHAVRPFTCRAHTSLSLAQCDAAAADPERRTPIEKHPVPAAIFGMAKSAITVACDERNLDPRSFELTNAVAVALSSPDAAERWARGELVFDAARTPNDARDAELSLASLARQGLLPPGRLLSHPGARSRRNAAKRERRGRRKPAR
ncbi:MAG TPA: YkgJ family cysteine cluster protein [Polyangiaceae bacterium]|nr:YkgJ family cysteine cluster protein [Polyangiaceae bacterium]